MKATLNNIIIREIKKDGITDSNIITHLKEDDQRRLAEVVFDAHIKFKTNNGNLVSFTLLKGTKVFLGLYVGAGFEYEGETLRKIAVTDIMSYYNKEVKDYKVEKI